MNFILIVFFYFFKKIVKFTLLSIKYINNELILKDLFSIIG